MSPRRSAWSRETTLDCVRRSEVSAVFHMRLGMHFMEERNPVCVGWAWDGAKTMEFWSPRNSEKVAHGRFPLGGE